MNIYKLLCIIFVRFLLKWSQSPLSCFVLARRNLTSKAGECLLCEWHHAIIDKEKIDVDQFKRWGLDNMYKAWFPVFDWMTYDENVQVNGFASFDDHSDMTMSIFMNIIPPNLPSIMLKYVQQVLHGRSRVKIYEDLGKEVIPREYLPDDYSGECVDEMIASMTDEKFRKYIIDLSSDKYGVDVKKRKQDSTTMEASFRKLNVD